MIRPMDTGELNCEKCGEPLDLSGLVDGSEIEAGLHRRAGHVQSAKFDLECRCCGHLNAIEFAFEEEGRV